MLLDSQTSPTDPGADTREKILDAAEVLFIERGYAATSLRAIAQQAGVNLAATNYHFGSKQGLLAAVFHRRVLPVNTQRLSGLDTLLASGHKPTTRTILEAFFAPFKDPEFLEVGPGIIGRVMGEPEAITKPILESEFSEVVGLYQGALAGVLPHLDATEIRWRFHFMIGSMIHLLQLQAPLGMATSHTSFIAGIDRLIDYSVAGLEQANHGNPHA